MLGEQEIAFRHSTRQYKALEWKESTDSKRFWAQDYERLLTFDFFLNFMDVQADHIKFDNKCSWCPNLVDSSPTLGIIFYAHSVLAFKGYKKRPGFWVHGYP